MSRLGQALAAAGVGGLRIGPGRLILVVGPSGAGKDTLIAMARRECRNDETIVFPRRVVTRQESVFEQHDTLTDREFSRALDEGRFALAWRAHGLQYGIPASLDLDIREGKTAVCNVSRAIVGDARRRYLRAAVVLVTAPVDVLAARLANRDRASDGAAGDRLQRAAAFDGDLQPDFIIQNVGEPEAGARELLAIVRGRRAVSDFPVGMMF